MSSREAPSLTVIPLLRSLLLLGLLPAAAACDTALPSRDAGGVASDDGDDGSASDAGDVDAGVSNASDVDAGESDAGDVDAGHGGGGSDAGPGALDAGGAGADAGRPVMDGGMASCPDPLPTNWVFCDDFESGDLSHAQGDVRWLGGVRTSVTTENARAGTHALAFTYQAAADGSDSFAEQRFTLTNPYDELWIAYDLYVPENYVHRTQAGPANNKLIAIYRDPYTSPGFQVNFSLTPDESGGSHLNIHKYDNGSEGPILSPAEGRGVLASSDRGTWIRIVVHLRVPTGDGTHDGVLQMWKDGVTVANVTDLPAYGGDGENYFDEVYLLGWANSGFTEETRFFVDNLVLSRSPVE